MTIDDIKELQELAKYYQNCAEYYHEKATWWHKQSDEDEAERERLIDIMCKIYELTGHDPKETVDDLAEKLDQIKELTKKVLKMATSEAIGMKTKYNTGIQIYRNIYIRLIEYTPEHFARLKAKRFLLINPKSKDNPSQNIWIPNAYLQEDGTLKPYVNIDFVFRTAALQRKFKYAGITIPAWLHEQLNR